MRSEFSYQCRRQPFLLSRHSRCTLFSLPAGIGPFPPRKFALLEISPFFFLGFSFFLLRRTVGALQEMNESAFFPVPLDETTSSSYPGFSPLSFSSPPLLVFSLFVKGKPPFPPRILPFLFLSGERLLRGVRALFSSKTPLSFLGVPHSLVRESPELSFGQLPLTRIADASLLG